MKAIFLSVTLLLGLTLALYSIRATAQPNPPSVPTGLTLIPDFQETVEPYITEVEPWQNLPEWVYNNRLFMNQYEDDTLVLSTKDSADMSGIFNSFYYWENNELVIEGMYGVRGGYGFIIRITKDKAQLYHLLVSEDGTPKYAREKLLQPRLEVTCPEADIILNELPDPELKQTVYGYVKFKSVTYFVKPERPSADMTWIKMRRDMKIYFRSDAKPF